MFKKFLALITVCSLIANGSSSVLACSNDYYIAFQKLINNKDTFIYFFGATDCPDCLQSEQKVWNVLNAKSSFDPTKKTLNYYLGAKDSIYQDYNARNVGFQPNTTAYNSYVNMRLLHYNVDQAANIFNDSFVKDVVKFMIQKYETKFSIPGRPPLKYLQRSDINLSGTPFFLFFAQGQYQGFYQGSITQLNAKSDSKTVGFFPLMYNHIVRHNWGVKN